MPTWREPIDHRPAADGDLRDVHAIYHDESASPHLGFDPCDPDTFAPIFEDLRAGGALRVACVGGRVLGVYAVNRLTRRMSHVAELSSVAVSPEARGTGFARAMVRDVIEAMRADGVRRVQLTVSADNARGIAFWTAMGFEHEGVHRAYFTRAGRDGDFDEVSMAMLIQ
ncbi:MAG: GNAT family N-acetyltransferase [Phycisphaerales bacterium]